MSVNRMNPTPPTEPPSGRATLSLGEPIWTHKTGKDVWETNSPLLFSENPKGEPYLVLRIPPAIFSVRSEAKSELGIFTPQLSAKQWNFGPSLLLCYFRDQPFSEQRKGELVSSAFVSAPQVGNIVLMLLDSANRQELMDGYVTSVADFDIARRRSHEPDAWEQIVDCWIALGETQVDVTVATQRTLAHEAARRVREGS